MSPWAGWESFSPEVHKLRALMKETRKYRNRPSWVLPSMQIVDAMNGVPPRGSLWFQSIKEAERYVALAREHDAGRIRDLVVQPQFPLTVVTPAGVRVRIGSYVGDFQYVRDGRVIVEDVKGVRTAVYRLKRKHAEAEHGIRVEEI